MRVPVAGVRLYFDVEGASLAVQGDALVPRPTLVLLHGGPGADHSLFKPEFSAMADTAQVVYLDQRGSGRSDRGEPAQWTWPRWADDVAEFCGALGIERPVLVGTSSGALVALHCAARHPTLTAGVVLDSPLGVPTTLDETLAVFEQRGGAPAREAAARYLGGDTSPAALAAWTAYALPLYGGDGARRRARALVNDEVQAHFRRGGCGAADVAPIAGSVTCPVLILAGADDPVVPAAGAPRLAALLTNAAVRVRVLDGVGHGVFRHASQGAFDLLRDFL